MTSAQMIASPLRFAFLIDRSFIMQGFRHAQVSLRSWCERPACCSVSGRKTPPGGPAACGVEFAEGHRYTVFAYRNERGRLETNTCSATGPGLIDAGYRGEVQVVFHNTDHAETFVVEPGMRIAQLVVLPVPDVTLVEREELAESERGERGFGSSRV
jgi:hypothetical protein